MSDSDPTAAHLELLLVQFRMIYDRAIEVLGPNASDELVGALIARWELDADAAIEASEWVPSDGVMRALNRAADAAKVRGEG